MTNVYIQEVIDYAKPQSISNDVMFSEVYHSLIHSPALETLLNLEHTYAMAVGNIINQRDNDLAHLEQRSQSPPDTVNSCLKSPPVVEIKFMFLASLFSITGKLRRWRKL